MNRKKLGSVLICFGVVLLGIAGLLVLRNQREATTAAQISQEVMLDLDIPEETLPLEALPVAETIPDYQYNPYIEMPEQMINGTAYIGKLEILDLGLTLPVIATTTEKNLQKAPCRYSGSAYQDDLIIGAHNYASHFGKLKRLSYGSEIRVTDMDGNVFVYQVADIEILRPEQVEDLKGGDWPLTLYTCTVGGQSRVVVRCDKV